MKSVIRRLTIDDISENKHIDTHDNNEPAICILQCGKVSIPLSEKCFTELINSINEFTTESIPCNQCEYVVIDDKNIMSMSCKLKAIMDGVSGNKVDRYNKKFPVNPLGSCQFAKQVPNKDFDINQPKQSKEIYVDPREQRKQNMKNMRVFSDGRH